MYQTIKNAVFIIGLVCMMIFFFQLWLSVMGGMFMVGNPILFGMLGAQCIIYLIENGLLSATSKDSVNI